MNLIQQAEELKNVPDQALAQMSQGMGSVPPYLVMSEMKRREQMRKAYTAQKGGDPVQRRTVMEEMRERFTPMEMQQQQQQPQVGQVAPNAPAPRMAGGGVVRRDGGGVVNLQGFFDQLKGASALPEVDPTHVAWQMPGQEAIPFSEDELATTPDRIAQRYGKVPSIEETMKQVQALRGPSRLAGIAEQLAAREQAARSKKADIGQILMQLGLGMAASRRPDFAGAIGEGGLGALHGYMQQKQLNQAQADNFMKQRMGVLEAMQQSDDVATREAGELNRGNIAGRNTEIMAGEQGRTAMMRAKKDERMNQLNREAQAKIAADRIAAEAALADKKEAGDFKVDEVAIKDWMQRNPGKSVMDAITVLSNAKHVAKAGKRDKGRSEDFYRLLNANNGAIQANEREIIELQKELADMGSPIKGQPDPKREIIAGRIASIRRHNDRIRQQNEEMYAESRGIPIAEPPPRPMPVQPRGGLSGLKLIGASDLFKTK